MFTNPKTATVTLLKLVGTESIDFFLFQDVIQSDLPTAEMAIMIIWKVGKYFSVPEPEHMTS